MGQRHHTCFLFHVMAPPPRRLSRHVTPFVIAGMLAGCNAITGAGDIRLSANDNDSGAAGVGGTGATTTTSGSGQGTTTTGSTSGGQGGSTSSAPQPSFATVEGVTISDIVLYQGVARPLMTNGAAANSTTPVVAQRGALVRVFYDASGYNGQPVTAQLTLGDTVLEQTVTLGGTSSAGALASTVNFDVPPPALSGDVSYRVDLLQPSESVVNDNPAGRFPSDESATDHIPTQASGTLKITLVPIRYNADGSGRLPDTSTAQRDNYQNAFFSMYPVTDVVVSVRAQPLEWGAAVAPNGSGWSSLLNAVADLRTTDGAPADNYYYGIFKPTGSTAAFCNGGCVAGLGFVSSPTEAYTRAAIGLGYGGSIAIDTALHELGHNHGREHAPCGTAGDPNYPYAGAQIGVWGYDLLSGQLFDPTQYVDMMSYCDPTWISDYNFTAIFNRLKAVSADIYTPPALQDLSYPRVAIDTDGQASWMAPITLARPPQGIATAITVQTPDGPQQTMAEFVGYDHLDGGVLFLPPGQPFANNTQLTATVQGKLIKAGF